MDRSVSGVLFRQLCDPTIDIDDRDEIEHTLAAIDDPRLLVSLHGLIDVDGIDPVVRRSAIEVLVRCSAHPTGDDLRRWWRSGDIDLMAGALPLMERTEADLVLEVLCDSDHPLLSRALLALDFGFEEPEWQAHKMRLLAHDDPDVRAAAAHCLLWDEPSAAELLLLKASFDAHEAVRTEAVAALRYYPTKAVLRRLTEMEDLVALADVVDYFQMAVDEPGEVGSRMRTWMADVVDVLHLVDEAAQHGVMVLTPAQVSEPWTKELGAALLNADMRASEVHDRIRRLDRESVRTEQRDSVAELLCLHVDAEIRSTAAALVVEWNLVDRAMGLLEDPVTWVRKSAIYALHDLDRSEGRRVGLGERMKGLIDGGTIAGTRSREAVRTWVAHANPDTVLTELADLVRSDRRESVVVASIEELGVIDGGAVVLAGLTDLLRQPPLVHWAAAGTMLDVCARLLIPVGNVDGLRSVDHVWLATAVAKADVAGVTSV